MNKHTRKKYPNAQRVKTKPEQPEYTNMSLFNETVQRATKAEAALEKANKRIAALERALAASRKVNEIAVKKAFASGHYTRETAPAHSRDLNSLSDAETEQLFAHLSVPDDDYVNEATVEPPAMPWRERVVRPLCALFRK